MPRPDTASLFDAALDAARRSYDDTPASVTIRTHKGLEVTFAVPPGWRSEDEGSPRVRIKSPDCFAEVLWTMVEVGHRMTRQAILAALEDRKRRWSEGTVGAVLSQMVELGVVDNSQACDPKGYGIAGI